MDILPLETPNVAIVAREHTKAPKEISPTQEIQLQPPPGAKSWAELFESKARKPEQNWVIKVTTPDPEAIKKEAWVEELMNTKGDPNFPQRTLEQARAVAYAWERAEAGRALRERQAAESWAALTEKQRQDIENRIAFWDDRY